MPVHQTDNNVLDQEFSSIRERFEAEMKKMEEEMARFRSRLMDHELNSGLRSTTSSSTIRMSSTSSEESSSTRKSESWMEDMNSPLIQDGDSGKVIKLRFDVSQYAPEEILVKTIDNKLQVNAKHEEKTENRSVYREYNREFMLPAGVNPELIKSSLSQDGVLTVEAPLPSIEYNKERTIPIEKC